MKSLSTHRNRKGAALAELAFVIPLLIFFIGGFYEISRVYYLQSSLEYGAKEAARIGSSIKESVDQNFMSKGTVSRTELESLIKNSVRVMGVIEEPDQFMMRYLNPAGNVINGVQDLPFDRQNNPGAIDFIEVEITYPGNGPGVNTPIPATFNVGGILQNTLMLSAKAVFKIEGRFER